MFIQILVIVLVIQCVKCEMICDHISSDGLLDGAFTYYYGSKSGKPTQHYIYKDNFLWLINVMNSERTAEQTTIRLKSESHATSFHALFNYSVNYYKTVFSFTTSVSALYCLCPYGSIRFDVMQRVDDKIHKLSWNIPVPFIKDCSDWIAFQSPSMTSGDIVFIKQTIDSDTNKYVREIKTHDFYRSNSLGFNKTRYYPDFLTQLDDSLRIEAVMPYEVSGYKPKNIILFSDDNVQKYCITDDEQISPTCKPNKLKTYLKECEVKTTTVKVNKDKPTKAKVTVKTPKVNTGLNGLTNTTNTEISVKQSNKCSTCLYANTVVNFILITLTFILCLY